MSDELSRITRLETKMTAVEKKVEEIDEKLEEIHSIKVNVVKIETMIFNMQEKVMEAINFSKQNKGGIDNIKEEERKSTKETINKVVMTVVTALIAWAVGHFLK